MKIKKYYQPYYCGSCVSKIACRCGYPADNNILTNAVPKSIDRHTKMTKKSHFDHYSKLFKKNFDFLLYIV